MEKRTIANIRCSISFLAGPMKRKEGNIIILDSSMNRRSLAVSFGLVLVVVLRRRRTTLALVKSDYNEKLDYR